jgi:isoamylase
VSYNDKHNEANGENNRDGANDNMGWNCGAEGPTDDPNILELRERQKRNLMATLLCSQGVAMILGGDELSHTQNGNNNAYCQDNKLTWLNWELTDRQKEFLEFVRRLIRIWREQPVLRRRLFFQGRAIHGAGVKDLMWFSPAGKEMTDADWNAGFVRTLGVMLSGDAIEETDEHGERIVGDTLLMLLNAHDGSIPFTIPTRKPGEKWQLLLDTAQNNHHALELPCGHVYQLHARSFVLFRLPPLDALAAPATTSLAPIHGAS